MGIVIEEADETLFWLEMIEELKMIDDVNNNEELNLLQKETNELISIFVASNKTIKKRMKR